MISEETLQVMRQLRDEVGSLTKTIPGTVSSVSLRVGEIALEITWEPPAGAVQAGVVQAVVPVPGGAVTQTSEEIDDGVRVVVAPLVGTFYAAPEPGARPFVLVGDTVVPGQAVGIVEAMKLMNQVDSEWAGEVVELLVKDGQAVEFGQELLRIRVAEQ